MKREIRAISTTGTVYVLSGCVTSHKRALPVFDSPLVSSLSLVCLMAGLSVHRMQSHQFAEGLPYVVVCRETYADRYRALDPIHTQSLEEAILDALLSASKRNQTQITQIYSMEENIQSHL